MKKHPLSRQQAEMLYKPFPIASVCRADVQHALNISEIEALEIDDSNMRGIAEKLADAYCENVFGIDLPIIAEQVLEEREA